MDETPIDKLTKEDQKYLEKFNAIETLSMTGCKLNSLENFPKCPKLIRVSDSTFDNLDCAYGQQLDWKRTYSPWRAFKHYYAQTWR